MSPPSNKKSRVRFHKRKWSSNDRFRQGFVLHTSNAGHHKNEITDKTIKIRIETTTNLVCEFENSAGREWKCTWWRFDWRDASGSGAGQFSHQKGSCSPSPFCAPFPSGSSSVDVRLAGRPDSAPSTPFQATGWGPVGWGFEWRAFSSTPHFEKLNTDSDTHTHTYTEKR